MPPFQIQLAIYVTNIFAPEMLLLLSIFMIVASFLYLNLKKIYYREIVSVNCPNNIKAVFLVSLSVFIASVITTIVKHAFRIPRPINMLVAETGYSFPSGHVTLIFAFVFVVIYVLFKYFKSHRTYINYLHSTLLILIAILVSFSRLVLQVHTPVDVMAGVVFGLVSAFLSVKIYYATTKYVDKKIFK